MASTEGTVSIPMREAMSGLTLKVRLPRSFTLRLKIGAWLIGLAGRIISVPVEISLDREGQ